MTNYYDLITSHGWSIQEFELAKKLSVVYREFDCGIVILNDLRRIYALTECSYNNNHSLSMWKTISNILKTRDKPIVTSYTDNQDKHVKGSKKYGGVKCKDDIAYFHVDGFEDIQEIYLKD